MRSGQFSIEFLVVLGVLLAILGSISWPMYNSAREDAQRVTRLAEAREAANEIVSALNTVYSGWVGSKQTIDYSLPSGVWQIRVDESVDGTDDVFRDNRMDVQIEMNWEGDNIVLVDTIIPSQYIENWGGVPLIDSNLSENSGGHTVVVSYENYPTIVLEEA